MGEYPPGESKSFVDAAIAAVNATQNGPVVQKHFTAGAFKPAKICIDKVRRCQLMIALVGFRYGSRVRDNPEISYTQLEIQTAAEANIPCLFFFLHDFPSVPLPRDCFIGPDDERQQEHRKRLWGGGKETSVKFGNPDELQMLVHAAILDHLAATSGFESGLAPEVSSTRPTAADARPPLAPFGLIFQRESGEVVGVAWQWKIRQFIADVSCRKDGGEGELALWWPAVEGTELEIQRIEPRSFGDGSQIHSVAWISTAKHDIPFRKPRRGDLGDIKPHTSLRALAWNRTHDSSVRAGDAKHVHVVSVTVETVIHENGVARLKLAPTSHELVIGSLLCNSQRQQVACLCAKDREFYVVVSTDVIDNVESRL